MTIEFNTDDFESLIEEKGMEEAMNVLAGRMMRAGMKNIDELAQPYFERQEAQGAERAVGSPASENNQAPSSDTQVSRLSNFNMDSPRINLQKMLEKEWFARVCKHTDVYNKAWTGKLIGDLFETEYGEDIAIKWAAGSRKKNKRTVIKGNVVGLLSDNRVINSNYTLVAREYIGNPVYLSKEEIFKEVSTFANYMGKGHREPYALWMTDYIKDTQNNNREHL